MTTDTVLTDAQCLSIGSFGQSPIKRLDHSRAIEQAVLQSPEIQRLREDAERYRWLRNESLARALGDGVLAPAVFNCDDEFQHSDVDHLQLSELDAEIDAAMEKQP